MPQTAQLQIEISVSFQLLFLAVVVCVYFIVLILQCAKVDKKTDFQCRLKTNSEILCKINKWITLWQQRNSTISPTETYVSAKNGGGEEILWLHNL